jgi:hypothetical protein
MNEGDVRLIFWLSKINFCSLLTYYLAVVWLCIGSILMPDGDGEAILSCHVTEPLHRQV